MAGNAATNGLFSALYSCYLFQYLMGYTDYKLINDRGEIRVKPRKYYNYVSCFLFAVFILSLSYFHLDNPSLNKVHNPLILFITWCYFLMVITLLFINFIMARVHSKSSMKLWKDMDAMTNTLKKIGIHLNYTKLKWNSFRFLFFGIGTFTVYFLYLLLGQELSNKLHGILMYGYLYFIVLNYICVNCCFTTFVRAITHMFDEVMAKLEAIMSKSGALAIKDKLMVKKIQKIHQELCDLVRLTNKVFSVQIVVSFGVSFIIVIFQSYCILCSIYTGTKYKKFALASVVWIMCTLSDKFVMAMASHRCMKRINGFSLQLLHEQFQIQAGHFFLIDLPIFTSVIGTATTYIILLLQTDPSVDIFLSMKTIFGVL